MWGRIRAGTMPLAQLSAIFQSLPLLPTSKLGPSGADSGWVGLCMFWDSVGLSNGLSCEAGSFSCRLNPHRCFQSEVCDFISHTGALGCAVCLAPQLFLLVYLHVNVGPLAQPAAALLCMLSTRLPVSTPPVWVNVSSPPPRLLDFHTVRFSGSSSCSLFLNLLSSFFWLCADVYQHLHVGRKSQFFLLWIVIFVLCLINPCLPPFVEIFSFFPGVLEFQVSHFG